MFKSIRIPVDEPSQISEARRSARSLARGLGFDEVRGEKVAIVVTEASTNLLKHAGGGEIIACVTDTTMDRASADLEILALDRGPGMGNLELCIENGYTTGSSLGQGLGAIVRLSNESDFFTRPGKGTALLARWTDSIQDSGSPRLGAVNVPKKGEESCGDSWGSVQTSETITVMVADGLGHGYDASVASLNAVRILYENPGLEPMALIGLSHQALRSSRGAAVSVACIDRVRKTVSYCGVGNVTAQIYSGARPQQHLVSVNGTAGHQIQRIREFNYPWPDNGMLILYSDGLATATGLEAQSALALRDPSLIAGVLYRDFSRGNDDSTVVVLKA
jgi:anti-sigma regulatory factor (Ser/Thr protein kinase)